MKTALPQRKQTNKPKWQPRLITVKSEITVKKTNIHFIIRCLRRRCILGAGLIEVAEVSEFELVLFLLANSGWPWSNCLTSPSQ